MEDRRETSVWHVATVATFVFVCIMVLSAAFGGGESAVAVVTQ